MFRYGKTSQAAISAMSYLAQHAKDDDFKANSATIAAARNLSRPLVAKLLTMLAQAGLVKGQPGPNGGYTIAKAAKDICLRDVVVIFERIEPEPQCPFGPGWCGVGDPCPLHNAIIAQNAQYEHFLKKITFDSFIEKGPKS